VPIEARPNRLPLIGPGAIERHVADMTATFSAELKFAEAQEKLAEVQQWLPIDGDPELSLGQLVAQNSSGPLRLGYGAWRDLLLGAQFRNGRGELITAGGRTVKNVAGYDLTKFMVGQEGVFGRLITLTTRTYKRPQAAMLARLAPDIRPVNRLISSDLRPHWMLLTADDLFCGFLGDQGTIDYYAAQVPAIFPATVQMRSLEQDIAHRASLWQAGGQTTFRAAVPPVRVMDFVSAARPASWVADPAFGIVLGTCEDKSAVRSAAEKLSGTVWFKQDGKLDFAPSDEGRRKLLDRLKRAFDPDNTLQPLPWNP
jgi:FAD/FMN-containing dehydrogenase